MILRRPLPADDCIQEVGKTNFSTRLLCIDKEIVKARAKYVEEGRIDRASEPFSVRAKQFWPLSDTGYASTPPREQVVT